jgi:AraC-like DNA-binding protein
MLRRFISIICLSLAAIIPSDNIMAQVKTPQMQSDLGKIPVSEKELHLVFFAGLMGVFIVMVGLLFRKYRAKGKSFRSRKESATDGMYPDSTFTPTFFSSESSPAILVAENHSELRLFITNTLRLNYRVISTADGVEACEKAIEIVPDLVITDRYMPGMDGPMLSRTLKSTEATSHVPVIILTSSEKDLLTTDWHRYADDLMHTSFDARELLMRVHDLIAQRKRHQEEYRRHIRSEDNEDGAGLPERPFLRKVLNVLETEYRDPAFGVEQLTARLGMTRLQLYRKLKALTTHAPGDFIKQYRLEQAKRLLAKDGSSVMDVAGRTGFANLSGFSKSFKDYTGKTPVEFAEHGKMSDQYMLED